VSLGIIGQYFQGAPPAPPTVSSLLQTLQGTKYINTHVFSRKEYYRHK
ncbi:hypothetical protein L917_01872, partial [Phytophthora nicotianae]